MIAIQQDAAMQAESRYDEALLRIQIVEDELKLLGRWQPEAPLKAAFDSKEAFFADTMSFAQWLQFVFVPAVREIGADRGEFPATSAVGAYAVRAFDGDDQAAALITALSSFDQLIEAGNHPDTMEAVACVRRFVDASKRKDEAAAKAEMIDAQKSAEGGSAPDIDRYVVRDVTVHGEMTVVTTTVYGKNPLGESEAMEMPFVSVRENGRAKVDMERTMARLMGGTGENASEEIEKAMTGALEDMGKQMQSAADEFDRERLAREQAEKTAVTMAFAQDELPAINATINESLGKEVMIAIDWGGYDGSSSQMWDLRRQLQDDLPVALRSMNEEKRAQLAKQIDTVRITTARDHAERCVRVEGSALDVTVALGSENGRFGYDELTCWLDWEMDAVGREYFRHPIDKARTWTVDLRTNHELVFESVELNVVRFSAYGDPLRSQWALYQLGELGIDPAGRVLAELVGSDPEFAAAARERLKCVRFEPVDDAELQDVTFDGYGLTIVLYSNEGAPGFGGDEALRERIRAAVLAG